MSSFDARLRMPGQTRLPLNVMVDICDDRIAFTRGGESLGDWPLGEIDVDVRHDGFHVKLEQEEIILNVAEPDLFAGTLGLGPRGQTRKATANGSEGRPGHNKGANDIAGRLGKLDPEEHFQDTRARIAQLAADLVDEDVAPADAFGRWLRLLREINVRHGQGAMPTPLFYRLNTELLDLIPAPPKADHQPVATGVGPRL